MNLHLYFQCTAYYLDRRVFGDGPNTGVHIIWMSPAGSHDYDSLNMVLRYLHIYESTNVSQLFS